MNRRRADRPARPGDVEFDLGRPADALDSPGEPAGPTHTIKRPAHLALGPRGRTAWFVEVFKQAVPLIRDERLKEDVLGFIGQEGGARRGARRPPRPTSEGPPGLHVPALSWGADGMGVSGGCSATAGLTGKTAEEWADRAASASSPAIEALQPRFLGQWVLERNRWTAGGAARTRRCLDLLAAWHGAEEVRATGPWPRTCSCTSTAGTPAGLRKHGPR